MDAAICKVRDISWYAVWTFLVKGLPLSYSVRSAVGRRFTTGLRAVGATYVRLGANFDREDTLRDHEGVDVWITVGKDECTGEFCACTAKR